MRMRVYAIYFSMRLGDAIDPCHLANGFEAVISYECQERRANPLSRIPRIQTSHARCDKASELVGGSLQCIGDLVDAAVWGIVPCVSKIYSVLYVGTLWMLLLVDLRSIR